MKKHQLTKIDYLQKISQQCKMVCESTDISIKNGLYVLKILSTNL